MANFKKYASWEIKAVVNYLNKNEIKFKGIRKWAPDEYDLEVSKKWADDLGVLCEFEASPRLLEHLGNKENRSDGDVLVLLENDETVLFEVQEDKMNENLVDKKNIFLDAISVFHFIKDDCPYKRGSVIKPNDYQNFLSYVEINKGGKVDYCKSDVILFYHRNIYTKEIAWMDAYDIDLMKQCDIKNFCIKNCNLYINRKDFYASRDSWESAFYFVKYDYIKNFRIKDFRKYLLNINVKYSLAEILEYMQGYSSFRNNNLSDEELLMKIHNEMCKKDFCKKVA